MAIKLFEMKGEKEERSAFPIRVRLARFTGKRWWGGLVENKEGELTVVCGDKRKAERHVPNDLWGELLPGSVR